MNERKLDLKSGIVSSLIYDLSNHHQFLDYKKEIEEIRFMFYSSNRAAYSKNIISDCDKKDDILRLSFMINDFVALVFELRNKANKHAKKQVIKKIRNILIEIVNGECQDIFDFLNQQEKILREKFSKTGKGRESINDEEFDKRMNDILNKIGISDELIKETEDKNDTISIKKNYEIEEDLPTKMLNKGEELSLVEDDYYSVLELLDSNILKKEALIKIKVSIKAKRYYLFIKNEISGSVEEKEKLIGDIISKLEKQKRFRKRLRKNKPKS